VGNLLPRGKADLLSNADLHLEEAAAEWIAKFAANFPNPESELDLDPPSFPGPVADFAIRYSSHSD
jgi:hypothetical protein